MAGRIKERKCKTRGRYLRPPVKCILVLGTSSSRSACQKTSHQIDSSFVIIYDDDEGLRDFKGGGANEARVRSAKGKGKVQGSRVAEVVSKVVPYLATELVQSDDMDVVIDLYTFIEVLLSMKPQILQRPAPTRIKIPTSSAPSQKDTPSPTLISPPP
nr:hypothetical protein [Tanacetum cinerariifolium]